MKTLLITIHMDNDTFRSSDDAATEAEHEHVAAAEASLILRDLAGHLQVHPAETDGTLLDSYGNTVGSWAIAYEPEF